MAKIYTEYHLIESNNITMMQDALNEKAREGWSVDTFTATGGGSYDSVIQFVALMYRTVVNPLPPGGHDPQLLPPGSYVPEGSDGE